MKTASMLSGYTVLCLFALPTLSLAQVTPQDVWSNMTAYAQSFGVDLDANLSERGNRLSVDDISLYFPLPQKAGLRISTGPLTLSAQTDGSVHVVMAKTQEYTLEFIDQDEIIGSITIQAVRSDNVTIATGTPGDITYESAIASYNAKITDLGGLLANAPRPVVAEGSFSARDIVSHSRIIEGDILNATGTVRYSSYSIEYDVRTGTQPNMRQTSTADGVGLTYALALPTQAMLLLNMAAAARDGMSVSLQSTAEKTQAGGSRFQAGLGMLETEMWVGPASADLRFDTNGLRLNANVKDYELEVRFADLFAKAFSGHFANGSFEIALPVLAQDTPSDALSRFTIEQLELDEDIWGLIDPQAALPRDPGELTIDLAAKVMIFYDLLDFLALNQLEQPPLEVNEVTMNSLVLEMVGAKLSGTGALTFDNGDYTTFGGIPAPTGSINLELSGANELLDTMVAKGLLPEQQAMGVRMVLGLFARPGPEPDTLISKIEIDGETGALSANGQRVK